MTTNAPTISPALSRLLAAVLGGLLVLSVTAIVATLVLNARQTTAEEDLEARADVARVAGEFMVRFNTYDAASVEQYTRDVDALLTTSAKTAFGEQVEDIVKLVKETELTSEGELLATGVASVDQDDATVLVVADAQTTSSVGPAQRHFRWEIDLQKVDGRWLVHDFTAVA